MTDVTAATCTATRTWRRHDPGRRVLPPLEQPAQALRNEDRQPRRPRPARRRPARNGAAPTAARARPGRRRTRAGPATGSPSRRPAARPCPLRRQSCLRAPPRRSPREDRQLREAPKAGGARRRRDKPRARRARRRACRVRRARPTRPRCPASDSDRLPSLAAPSSVSSSDPGPAVARVRRAPDDPGSLEERHDLRRRLLGDAEVAGQLDGRDVVAAEQVAGREAVHDRHRRRPRPRAAPLGADRRAPWPPGPSSTTSSSSALLRAFLFGRFRVGSMAQYSQASLLSRAFPCSSPLRRSSPMSLRAPCPLLLPAPPARRRRRGWPRSSASTCSPAVIGTNFTTNFSAPNTESTRASNLLTRELQGAVGRRRAGRLPGHAVDARRRRRAAGDATSPPRSRRCRTSSSVSDPYTTPGGISKSRNRRARRTRSSTPSRRTSPNSVGTQMIKLAEQHSTPQLAGAARRSAHPAVRAAVAVG